MLGVAFYIDEITMRFKDHHVGKNDDIKSQGDGLQTNALCNRGYTYKIFM